VQEKQTTAKLDEILTQNKMLRIFGPKRKKVAGGWRKVRNGVS